MDLLVCQSVETMIEKAPQNLYLHSWAETRVPQIRGHSGEMSPKKVYFAFGGQISKASSRPKALRTMIDLCP